MPEYLIHLVDIKMRAIISLLILTTVALGQTVIYSGSLLYIKSGKVNSLALYYEKDQEALKVDISSLEEVETKFIKFNVSYIRSIRNVNSSCSTNSFYYGNVDLLRLTKMASEGSKLSTDDSRTWSLILTGSWYNEEILYANSNVTLSSPYWKASISQIGVSKLPILFSCETLASS